MSNRFEDARRSGTLDIETSNQIGQGLLPGFMGIEFTDLTPQRTEAFIEVQPHHLNPSGFLHGGTIISLADTIAGYASVLNLPKGASGFTTIELKTNFLASAKGGKIFGCGTPVHLGRNTQVWDVRIWREADNKTIAHFRCTQMVLWPKK